MLLPIFVGILMPVSGSAQSNAPGATRLPKTQSENHALGQHVTRPYGDYRYVPQDGLYKDVTLGDAAEDLGRDLRNVSATVDSFNQRVGWSFQPTIGDLTFISHMSGLGYTGHLARGQWGARYNGNSADYLTVMLGPLIMDNFYAGYGAIYSDLNGTYPGVASLPPDDRWIQIVWLSFRASFVLGNSIAISIQPYLYYLPNTGQLGWSLPGPNVGAGFYSVLGNQALFGITWEKELGTWNLMAYDQFSPFSFSLNIFNAAAGNAAQWGDLSPVDRVGRYSLGYGSTGNLANYNPQAGYSGPRNPANLINGYYNIMGIRAYGRLGYRTRSMLYFDRADTWDKSFNHAYARITGGGYLRNGDADFSSFVGYDFYSSQPFDTYLHWVMTGVRKRLSQTFAAYASAGYYWGTGPQSYGDGALGLVGVQHQLGLYTSQQAEVGRRVFQPVRSAAGIEDYAEYSITHQLGLRTQIRAITGVSERRIHSSVENSYVVKYAGVFLTSAITPRLSANATTGWERSEAIPAGIVLDRWLYRLGLFYSATQNIQTQLLYQYQDVHGTPAISYSEHFIYLGVTKHF